MLSVHFPLNSIYSKYMQAGERCTLYGTSISGNGKPEVKDALL
jgi:hypothetical protein